MLLATFLIGLATLLQANVSNAVPTPLVEAVGELSAKEDGRSVLEKLAGETVLSSLVEASDESSDETEGELGPGGQTHDEEYVNSMLPKEIVKSLGLYGGDIRLTSEQKKLIDEMEEEERGDKIEKRAVVTQSINLWPNGRVPYSISSQLGYSARNAISSAINQYSRDTCIRFVPRTTERDYVRFIKDSGCYSYIGRTGGVQAISIGTGCEGKGIVMHEMFHALGRWHEQSRPDRDNYIRINYQNIEQGAENNFAKLRSFEATTNNIPYDFSSLMHYSAYSFSKNNNPTITPIVGGVRHSDLGQRSGFTSRDRDHINAVYCAGGPSPTVATWNSWSSWSSCSVTCEQGTQTRTRTCKGTGCVGSNRQTRGCNTNTRCYRWGSWGAWSACSATCNSGIQTRYRTCVQGRCLGSNSESKECRTSTCPGVWSSWSAWGECSEECGSGEQVRTRQCSGGICSGNDRETSVCVQAPFCLQGAEWGAWSQWSACTETCGYSGRQTRSRTCNGDTCVGPNQEVRKCNIATCPSRLSPGPGWGSWGAWRSCSRTCGGGFRSRLRRCVSYRKGCPGTSFEIQGCNYQSCSTPEDSVSIATLQPITVNGYQLVSCHEINIAEGNSNLYTLNKDKPFTTDIIEHCIELAASKGFQYVGITGGYCNSGSNNQDTYTGTSESDLCENGTGSLSSTSLTAYMDVYSINN